MRHVRRQLIALGLDDRDGAGEPRGLGFAGVDVGLKLADEAPELGVGRKSSD